MTTFQENMTHLYNQVIDFNMAAGCVDHKNDTSEWWDSVQLQCKLLVEEATEAYTACKLEDKVELLDGAVDTLVIAFRLVDMLEKAGYDVADAFFAINKNNDSKVFDSFFEAIRKSAELEERDGKEHNVATAYVAGVEKYTIRNNYNKIVKPIGFKGVDLTKYCP